MAEEKTPKTEGFAGSQAKESTKEEEIKGIAEILGSKEAINYYKDKEQKEKEIKIRELRETIENSLKVIGENGKVIKENEVQKKAILEKLAKLNGEPKKNESKEDIESFDRKYIEDKIYELLKPIKSIKNIRMIKITKDFLLYVNMTAEKFFVTTDISLEGISIVNQGNSVGFEKNYLSKVKATRREEDVKDILAEYTDSIGVRLIEFIEKEKNKIVKKIWIEDGQLKVLYKKDK